MMGGSALSRGEKAAIVFCAAVILFYVSPLWVTLGKWGGTFDWGYFFFLAEVDRKTVMEFGQFPLWNPYYCGGGVHLANPQTYFLSPTFLFILAFGTPVGIRLTLTCAVLLAFDGTRRLLRALGVDAVGAAVGGLGYAMCGTLAQHLGGGHVGWVGLCVLPYVLHSFHRAIEGERRHMLYGGLFLAWIFGHFGGYTFPYSALTLGIYGLLWSVSRRRVGWGLLIIAFMIGFALALSAVRLLPILEFMSGHPRLRPDIDIIAPWEFFEIYFLRRRTRAVHGHPYVWPEYGNYLGPAALLLVGLGVWTLLRRRRDLWPVLAAMLMFMVFHVGNVVGFPWWVLKHLPIFRYMRAPSRFTVLVALFACALIGLAIDRWVAPLLRARSAQPWPQARPKWMAITLAVLGALFLVDESSFNREQWFQTLSLAAPRDPVSPSFHQVRGDRHRMYAYPRANRGTLDCFEETPLDISPRLSGTLPAEEYAVDPGAGTVRRLSWTPNQVVVESDFSRPGVVVVNQNYHPGWRVTGGVLVNEGGLLAARVEAGQQRVTFRFMPRSFLIGLAISFATVAYGIWLWRRWRGNRSMATR